LKELYPNEYKKFQPRRLEDILIILESETRFSLLVEKTKANSQGLLIPFKNGVLNSKTLVLLKHDPNYYCTHIIAENFKFEDNFEDTLLAKFITQLVGHRAVSLNILRAYLNIIFTNNTRYQLAFYIYGPVGTGKSTLINILLYLLGPEASLSTTLTNLNSRFGLSRISHKLFLVINDMSYYKGKEPKTLKELITGDIMESEKKYKTP
jgi:phage/plasmid-associated DNA primase